MRYNIGKYQIIKLTSYYQIDKLLSCNLLGVKLVKILFSS